MCDEGIKSGWTEEEMGKRVGEIWAVFEGEQGLGGWQSIEHAAIVVRFGH